MPNDQRSASGPQWRMNISGGRNNGVPAGAGAATSATRATAQPGAKGLQTAS